jgi:hypothetical protein
MSTLTYANTLLQGAYMVDFYNYLNSYDHSNNDVIQEAFFHNIAGGDVTYAALHKPVVGETFRDTLVPGLNRRVPWYALKVMSPIFNKTAIYYVSTYQPTSEAHLHFTIYYDKNDQQEYVYFTNTSGVAKSFADLQLTNIPTDQSLPIHTEIVSGASPVSGSGASSFDATGTSLPISYSENVSTLGSLQIPAYGFGYFEISNSPVSVLGIHLPTPADVPLTVKTIVTPPVVTPPVDTTTPPADTTTTTTTDTTTTPPANTITTTDNSDTYTVSTPSSSGVTTTTSQSLGGTVSGSVQFNVQASAPVVTTVATTTSTPTGTTTVTTTKPATVTSKPVTTVTKTPVTTPVKTTATIVTSNPAIISNTTQQTITLTSIVYTLDGKVIHTSTTFPDTWNFDTHTIPDGAYNLTAVYHYSDNTTQSSITIFTVQNGKTFIQSVTGVLQDVWLGFINWIHHS